MRKLNEGAANLPSREDNIARLLCILIIAALFIIA